jgi:hypothetical protein
VAANPAPIKNLLVAYRLAATWLKVPLKLVPTVPMMVTAATAMSAAINPYSIAVTPRLSVIKQRRDINVGISNSPGLRISPQKLDGECC